MVLGAVRVLMAGGSLANMILGIFPPLATAYTKWSYSKWPNMLPGLGDLVEMRYRGWVVQEDGQLLQL